MNPGKSICRHPFLWLSGLLLAVVVFWTGHFLATFDLNRYREELASEVSKRLQMPVRLGEAHLEVREAGIDFHFNDVQIGAEQTSTELRARKVWLQLAWHGLLLGKPILTEVALDSPRLRIAPSGTTSPDDAPPAGRFDIERFRDLQIGRIEIIAGALDISWLDDAGTSRSFALEDLSSELDDFGLDRTVGFNAAGNLVSRGPSAHIAVKGSVALPATGSLRDAAWDIALEAKGLDIDRLARLIPDSAGISATGIADLELFFKGSLAREVALKANLAGTGTSFTPGTAGQTPIPLKHLQVAGIWQQKEGRHDFRQVALQLDDLRLAGEFSIISRTSGHQLTGTLSNSMLPLDVWRHWMPPAVQAANPLLSHQLPGGLISLSHARFRADIPADPSGFYSFSLQELHGEVRGLSWDLGRERKAELASLAFRLDNDSWQLERGTGTIVGLPTALSATVSPQSDGQQQISLDLAISGPAGQFVALQGKSLPPNLTLGGNLEVKGHLAGTPAQYRFDAQADLAQLEINYDEMFHLPPTPGGLLTVHGEGTPSNLQIGQGELVLSPFTGQLTGTVDWTGAPAANLSAHIRLNTLADAYPNVPVLGKLQLRGGAAISIAATGPLATLQPQISLELVDVSIPTHGFVADISQLNGRLRLQGKGIRSETLTALLGKSPVTLTATVDNIDAPRLALDVQSPSVRANELIFHSDRMILRELDGHLIFDRDGLFFAPVKVRLDGGTRATVNGSVKNFDSPRVDLDITGEYANVKEIIGLWTDESPEAAADRHARHKGSATHPFPPIRIAVDASGGDLYSMKFSRAKALIVPTSGQLLIHPLDFNVGEGYCSTQVLVDYSDKATVLRVSGHVEDVDAYQIYNQLLDRKSIMRGSLRGDFYLQGELGDHGFLPTSFGNTNISVRKGVMRHSPFLSTIFSLLNVSQLFKFKLPDVNLEGVPFTLLTGELAIDKGVVSTRNIRVDSDAMNMSYVGNYDMVSDRLDLLVVVKPLGTVDKIVSSLPIAGWILGGDQRALITAQFKVTGPGAKPKVEAIPISSWSRGILDFLKRTLSVPLKLFEDPAILWGGGGTKPEE
jgi:hypothetical protein